jgi:hypothetical protein
MNTQSFYAASRLLAGGARNVTLGSVVPWKIAHAIAGKQRFDDHAGGCRGRAMSSSRVIG